MAFPSDSVNQRLPSGPTEIPAGPIPFLDGDTVMIPAVVIRPILPLKSSVNHRFPSGPAVTFDADVAAGDPELAGDGPSDGDPRQVHDQPPHRGQGRVLRGKEGRELPSSQADAEHTRRTRLVGADRAPVS
jgi:hypothetical protein